jgi:hypothetical protein
MDDDKKKKPIPPARVGLWVIGGVIGLYFLITGLVGILS